MERLLGTRISHFRIVDILGRGGMGEVYVGYDETLDRKVALKSLRSDVHPDADSRIRFLREARVLSQLAHPNICQIFDYIEGGESDVLVLELIQGRGLGKAMRQGLDPRRKLQIAEQIAGVLVAAHEKGIVHRDLKPENIMLTEQDQVKVLDFGLSRLQQDDLTRLIPPRSGGPALTIPMVSTPGEAPQGSDRPAGPVLDLPRDSSARITTVGSIMGTLGYMSPEQARGETATAASDLYSFGLVLQELFTGAPPYPKGLDAASLLEQAQAGATLPVAGIDPDLANLISRLKALAPAARPSAVDAADRLAWIRAKPQRRRRKVLLVGAVVLLVLFGAAMTVQSVRATRAERAARLEAETSKQISRFLLGLFRVSDPGQARGNQVTARELLDKGAERIEGELKDQPEIQARLMNTMGNVYYMLGLYPQAQPLHEHALVIRERLFGREHPTVADSLNNLAVLYKDQGRPAKAEPLFLRSLQIYEKGLGPDHADVGTGCMNLACVYEDQGKYAEAEPLYKRSLAIWEKALGPEDPDVATALMNLAGLYREQGRDEESERLYRQSLKIWAKTSGLDHPSAAACFDGLAVLASRRGRDAEAESLFLKGLGIREKALAPDHPNLAESLFGLGLFYVHQARYDKAQALLQRASDIREKTLGPDHPNTALSFYGLARLEATRGHAREALLLLQRALPAGGASPWMQRMGGEPDLASLRVDPAFRRMVAEVERLRDLRQDPGQR